MCYSNLQDLHTCLTAGDISASPDKELLNEILVDIGRAEPHSVVLNFECCDACSDAGFAKQKETVMKLVRLFVDRLHMVMFADFATKALIHDWDANLLGPNPFVPFASECSQNFDLRFKVEALRACPSAQLAAVANLCADGHAHVHAMGGTVVFSLNPVAVDNSRYQLEVLTVAEKVDGRVPKPEPSKMYEELAMKMEMKQPVPRLCSLTADPAVHGAAGHVLLKYPR